MSSCRLCVYMCNVSIFRHALRVRELSREKLIKLTMNNQKITFDSHFPRTVLTSHTRRVFAMSEPLKKDYSLLIDSLAKKLGGNFPTPSAVTVTTRNEGKKEESNDSGKYEKGESESSLCSQSKDFPAPPLSLPPSLLSSSSLSSSGTTSHEKQDKSTQQDLICRIQKKILSMPPSSRMETFSRHLEAPTTVDDILKRELDSFLENSVSGIFIDHSNILFGMMRNNVAQVEVRLKKNSVKMNVDALVNFIEQRPPTCEIETRFIAGNLKVMRKEDYLKFKQNGYDAHLLETLYNGKEQLVDELVQNAIMSFMFKIKHDKKYSGKKKVVRIVTGDGNINHGRLSFVDIIKYCIQEGFHVILSSWNRSTSKRFNQIRTEFPGRFIINHLDDAQNDIVSVV